MAWGETQRNPRKGAIQGVQAPSVAFAGAPKVVHRARGRPVRGLDDRVVCFPGPCAPGINRRSQVLARRQILPPGHVDHHHRCSRHDEMVSGSVVLEGLRSRDDAGAVYSRHAPISEMAGREVGRGGRVRDHRGGLGRESFPRGRIRGSDPGGGHRARDARMCPQSSVGDRCVGRQTVHARGVLAAVVRSQPIVSGFSHPPLDPAFDRRRPDNHPLAPRPKAGTWPLCLRVQP